MIAIHPVTLQGNGVRLEPLTLDHHDALAMAAADGRLWELWFTSVPGPGKTAAYIEEALARQRDGHHLAFAVRDVTTDAIVGTTSYTTSCPQSIVSRLAGRGTPRRTSART